MFKEYKCNEHGYGWIPDDDTISIVINPIDIPRCSDCSVVVREFNKDYNMWKKIPINVLSDSEKQHAKCGKYAIEEWEKTLEHWKKKESEK